MSLIKNLAYGTVEALTFGKGVNRSIGGEAFRFPAKFSRYYESDYEPETFRFFRKHVRSGETVFDIGGHIGLFAVMTARLVGEAGQVHSFEPTPFTRGVLQKVVDLNGVSNIVEVRHEAVSANSGRTVFFDTGTEVSNANSLVRSELSQTEIQIEMTSIDEYAATIGIEPDCVKIDVEGAELDVLIGGRRVFTERRPAVRLGLHPPFITAKGDTLDAIWDIIAEYGYSVEFDGQAMDREAFISQPQLFDVELIPISK